MPDKNNLLGTEKEHLFQLRAGFRETKSRCRRFFYSYNWQREVDLYLLAINKIRLKEAKHL